MIIIKKKSGGSTNWNSLQEESIQWPGNYCINNFPHCSTKNIFEPHFYNDTLRLHSFLIPVSKT